MSETTPAAFDPARDVARMVDAVLEGGPDHVPVDLRTHRVPSTEQKIKVSSYGGYEHFERAGDGDAEPVVFRWTGRTRIAE
ncbi:DUF5988 family protein [Micromonospora sp. NBS 11-29]|uniref:DUF5988 family protein n=1 Tax=Micromonospora sp. NBS 11-29 TaxID=1960879 RepID=UPI000B776723|nr:DUF5988 family protein [Micromonospora sp. NBS 11-29]